MILQKKLKAGDIVDIYTDYRNLSGYQGQAVLIKRIEKGHSFINNDDKLFQKEEDNPIQQDRLNNLKVYNELIKYTEEIKNKDLESIVKKLKKYVQANYKEPEQVYKHICLLKLKPEYRNRADEVKTFITKFTAVEILKYFYQRYVKEFSPHIYRDEKWEVKFFAEQYDVKTKIVLHYTEFKTARRISRLEIVCPNEDAQNCDIVYTTTDNKGLSNKDRELIRRKKNKIKKV